jgi:protein MpaA
VIVAGPRARARDLGLSIRLIGAITVVAAAAVSVINSQAWASPASARAAVRVELSAADGGATAQAVAVRPRISATVIGRSVRGDEIVAHRLGTPGGRVVLIVGNVHGDEPKGRDIVRALRELGAPPGVDLWLVETINPDGLAARTRTNANGVDLNRNFSINWSHIAPSAFNRQHSGAAPADQPETQAIEALIRSIQPQITVWYHQASNRVSVGGARPEIPREYARLVGQLTGDTPCTAGCTGTGTQFVNSTVPSGTGFLVELPSTPAVTADVVARHAAALRSILTM